VIEVIIDPPSMPQNQLHRALRNIRKKHGIVREHLLSPTRTGKSRRRFSVPFDQLLTRSSEPSTRQSISVDEDQVVALAAASAVVARGRDACSSLDGSRGRTDIPAHSDRRWALSSVDASLMTMTRCRNALSDNAVDHAGSIVPRCKRDAYGLLNMQRHAVS